MTADATPTPAQRFLALVEPAARRAGYLDYGGQARLARATGIPDSTLSRMFKGTAMPEVTSFEALASALDLPVRDLLIAAQIVSESSLSETQPTRVRSVPSTVEEAAAALGITSDRGMEMFAGMVETLRKGEHSGDNEVEPGGAAAAQR